MPSATPSGFQHLLCGLILLTRVGDLVSTRLATPTLKLEANPIMRKLGWRFGLVSLLACLFPYVSTTGAVVVLVFFAFVCYSNFSRGWFAHVLGEERMQALALEVATRSSLPKALAFQAAGHAFLGLIGLMALTSSQGPSSWSFWIGVGLLVTTGAMFGYTVLYTSRLFRRAREAGADANDPPWPEPRS